MTIVKVGFTLEEVYELRTLLLTHGNADDALAFLKIVDLELDAARKKANKRGGWGAVTVAQ